MIYLRTGVLEPSLGIYFPMLNGYEELSAVLMHLFNIFVGVPAAFIAATSDSVVYLMFANLTMIPSIIRMELLELKISLEKHITTTV